MTKALRGALSIYGRHLCKGIYDSVLFTFGLRAALREKRKRMSRTNIRQERRKQNDETNESSQPHACHHSRSDDDFDRYEFWHGQRKK